jgi:hypothetical protein
MSINSHFSPIIFFKKIVPVFSYLKFDSYLQDLLGPYVFFKNTFCLLKIIF